MVTLAIVDIGLAPGSVPIGEGTGELRQGDDDGGQSENDGDGGHGREGEPWLERSAGLGYRSTRGGLPASESDGSLARETMIVDTGYEET